MLVVNSNTLGKPKVVLENMAIVDTDSEDIVYSITADHMRVAVSVEYQGQALVMMADAVSAMGENYILIENRLKQMIYVDYANGYEVDFRGYDGEIEYAVFYRTGSREASVACSEERRYFRRIVHPPTISFWTPGLQRHGVESNRAVICSGRTISHTHGFIPSLFPLLALIYYRRLWLFLINVPFYGIYAILVAISKVFYM